EDGAIIVNSTKNIEELKTYFNGEWKLAVVDATSIAKDKIGVPIVNTTMLGALIKASNLISIDSLEEPLKERFGAKANHNLESCKLAFERTIITKTARVKVKAGASPEAEKLLTWKEILPGAVIVSAGNAKQYRTGDWRSASPKYDNDKCNQCGLCFIYCPEGCIRPLDNGYFEANLYYCKGCGICAKECPKKAITMIEV
ncbi:MAG TPA: 2-oxoacid:acceptor oxidoreductase family protein, partial [Dehalococcoidia bacterium]|nr:2-oxoacid:acceptor oxidoreductase family protein [Dehalococcoidia bacterium]